ncbi:FAD-binding oxidoreductase [Hymenobacter busanensis]|uniref:FAD-binding oxidoreductase n=1 Tax=Hymenobacter busanensis TaxID=2607656 RepID=A0A7L5A0A5_9BACT|nr:FAD-dependent oxidoreductase [Hymenobacter busanensis]KAA9331284.1 FAD-binding oxidoreductase [Hymenobacter busanensis]QHJ08435.1 FAD-dependent oxidoreductase [Hymenobacter busanensis]
MNPLLSYWEHQTFLRPADVAVVGAGIVGLTAAIYARRQRPTVRVVVLERDVLPNGASTKNAGFACFGSISELLEQERRGGTEALLSVVRYRWEGLRQLRELLGDEAIGYQPVGGYELFRAADAELATTCRQELDYYNALLGPVIGTNDIFADATAQLPGYGFAGVHTMLENKAEGTINTGRMMDALLRLAWQEGVTVLHGLPVLGLESHAAGATLRTALADLEAGQVLLATNAFSRQFFPELDVTPGRGQVLVTEPLDGLRLPGSFHYDKGYYYFRQVGNRVLLGGGRNLDFEAEATTEPGLTPLVQQRLEKLLTDVILPGQRPRIDYRWSGVMGFGQELEPFIGELAPHIYGALRCNGMGVAMGTRSGQRAAELLMQ